MWILAGTAHSTCYARILEQHTAVSATNADVNATHDLTTVQWQLAEKVCSVLAILKTITRESSKASASAALIIPMVASLKASLCSTSSNHGVKAMKKDMLESLHRYYAELFSTPTYVCSTLLDPPFKDILFLDKEQAHQILSEQYAEYATDTTSTPECSPPSKKSRTNTQESSFWDLWSPAALGQQPTPTLVRLTTT